MAVIRVFVDSSIRQPDVFLLLPISMHPVQEIPPPIEISPQDPGQFDLKQLKSLLGRFILIDFPAMKLIKIED